MLSFGEAAFEFWEKSCVRECAELHEAEGKELHGSSTQTMQVRRANPTFRTRVSCTDRVRGFGSARVSSMGRVREACALISSVARGVQLNTDRFVIWLARVSEGFSTGRVELIFSTGRAIWHGSRSFCTGLTGQAWFCMGRAIFSLL